MKFYGLSRRVVLSSLPFSLIFLGALGVSAVNYKAETDARKATASVPNKGVVASDGWFEGDGDEGATGKICQSGSLKMSYWEN